jgi:hypothetical protein
MTQTSGPAHVDLDAVAHQEHATELLGQRRLHRGLIFSRQIIVAMRAISTIDRNTRAAIAVIPKMTKTTLFVSGRSSSFVRKSPSVEVRAGRGPGRL